MRTRSAESPCAAIADRAQTVIRVDSYASAESVCDFNWEVLCRRAQTIADASIHPRGGARWATADHIDVFAHGESGVAGRTLAPNRRSTIVLPPAPLGSRPRATSTSAGQRIAVPRH